LSKDEGKDIDRWVKRLLSLDTAAEFNLKQKNIIDMEKTQIRNMIRTKQEERGEREKNGK